MSNVAKVNNFEWIEEISQLNENFIKTTTMKKVISWSKCSKFFKKLHDLDNDLPISTERINIEIVKTPVANLHYKVEYVICIRNLKQALNNR